MREICSFTSFSEKCYTKLRICAGTHLPCAQKPKHYLPGGGCILYTIKNYHFAESVDEAAALLQKSRANTVLGGGTWLRLGERNIATAIDLSHLGLDQITETEEEITLGAMVSLRALEQSTLLQSQFGGLLARCVRHIVGVQFRGLATVGASVASRYGFSDVITALLALDTEVELCPGGRLPLAAYLQQPPARQLLVAVHIKKDGCTAVHTSHRLTETDFPVLAVAAARCKDGSFRISVGARPAVAQRCPQAEKAAEANGPEAAGEAAAEMLQFGSNTRGSAEYRKVLAKVLVTRALTELAEKESLAR